MADGTGTPALLDAWRESLAGAHLPDTLLVVGDVAADALDLTNAHPSGLATLLAGRPTRLSMLIREPEAHAAARRRARAIRATAGTSSHDRGMRAGYLAAGVATWLPRATPGSIVDSVAPATQPLSAPVLLRGCTLRPRDAGHDDYDLDLEDAAVVNPRLVRRLEVEYGVTLDGEALGHLAFGLQGFDPGPVHARIEELCEQVPGFRVDRRLLVGVFTSGSGALIADLEAAEEAIGKHPAVGPILRAEPTTDAGSRTMRQINPRIVADEDPETAVDADAGVLDLDAGQRRAVTAVLGGEDVIVEGPPGSGHTQTLAAGIAAIVARGKRALVVTPHRATADTMISRLRSAGLGDTVLDLHDGAGDRSAVLAALETSLDAALGARAQASAETWAGVRGANDRILARWRESTSGLAEATAAVHELRQPWGVSAYDAMVALAALMAGSHAPRTRVRLSHEVTKRLGAERREALRTDLRDVARLKAFTLTRVDTRWLDARVRSEQDAENALAAAVAARDGLGRARRDMAQLAASSGLSPAKSAADWRPRLDLLLGVRDTLDRLLPAVFEQPLGDLIAAVGPEGGPADAGRLARRSLRRRARNLVRPGVHVEDLHAVLVAAQEQRVRWLELAEAGGWPRVPTGLTDAQVAVETVEGALAVLAHALAGTGTPELLKLPLDKLEQRLADLAADPDGVRDQPRRTLLLDRLREAGLGDLLADLRIRRCTADDVDGELDLAWWTSVLEAIIRGDQRLARHDPQRLREHVEALRESDARLIAAAAARASAAAVTGARRVLDAHPDQLRWLQVEVVRGQRSAWPHDLFRKAPDAVAALRPVWVMSPDAVARVLPAADAEAPLVDVVVVDDAGQVGLAESVAAVARGRRVLAGGDRRRLPPATGGPSLLAALAERLPVHRLDRGHRTRDARLVGPLQSSYPEGWRCTPGSAADAPFTLVHVPDGIGVPAPGEEFAVSSQQEVRRVVELVAEHAATRPGQSLLVVTLGARHAERIEEALRSAVGDAPHLARWLDVHWTGEIDEPFLVRPVHRIAGLERDAAIVSIGLARTPHGRIMHRFGVLDGRFGRACLLAALSRSRRNTTLVCSFTADELSPDRTRTDGARMLREVLGAARGSVGLIAGRPAAVADLGASAAGSTSGLVAASGPDPAAPGVLGLARGTRGPNALVADLCSRLTAAGMPVLPNLAAPDWPLDIAVLDGLVPGRGLLAVDIDGPAYARCPSVRFRDRQRRQAWERAGWVHLRVAAMDLFCDPEAEVERILDAWRAAGGLPASVVPAEVVPFEPVRGPFPDVATGLPPSVYGAADFRAVAAWVVSDGVQRTDEEVAHAVREALGIIERGGRTDRLVVEAVRAVNPGVVHGLSAPDAATAAETAGAPDGPVAHGYGPPDPALGDEPGSGFGAAADPRLGVGGGTGWPETGPGTVTGSVPGPGPADSGPHGTAGGSVGETPADDTALVAGPEPAGSTVAATEATGPAVRAAMEAEAAEHAAERSDAPAESDPAEESDDDGPAPGRDGAGNDAPSAFRGGGQAGAAGAPDQETGPLRRTGDVPGGRHRPAVRGTSDPAHPHGQGLPDDDAAVPVDLDELAARSGAGDDRDRHLVGADVDAGSRR